MTMILHAPWWSYILAGLLFQYWWVIAVVGVLVLGILFAWQARELPHL